MGGDTPADGAEAHGFDEDRFRTTEAPFTDLIGLEWDELSPSRVVAHVDVGAHLHQPYGIVHGGVYASIVETLGSVGAAIHVLDEGKIVVGVSNSTDFLRAHRDGRLTAVGEPIHTGRLQHLWLVTIRRDGDDAVVARGQVRLQVLDADYLRS
jgi:1,4-dihydroxy-2-naphthoyl-CoA hydrolase